MDIAAISVIASGVVGLAGVGAAVWNSLQPAKVAREGRIEQRRADAYLEILKLAELESHFRNAQFANTLTFVTEGHPNIEPRVKVPEEPHVESRASIAAHVAAFASEKVATAYGTWRTCMDNACDEYDSIMFYWRESVPVERMIELERLLPMKEELLPAENNAREAMADQIAIELRHRRPVRRSRAQVGKGVERRAGRTDVPAAQRTTDPDGSHDGPSHG